MQNNASCFKYKIKYINVPINLLKNKFMYNLNKTFFHEIFIFSTNL